MYAAGDGQVGPDLKALLQLAIGLKLRRRQPLGLQFGGQEHFCEP